MTTTKGYIARPSYRFLSADRGDYCSITSESAYELHESDIFNSDISTSPEFLKTPSNRRLSKMPSLKRANSGDRMIGTPCSLPVNIPDWSKILRNEYRANRRESINDEDGDFEGGALFPPHEFLARSRMASLSVHEGVGRTLKGRDLRRVRNAIWEKTGYQD